MLKTFALAVLFFVSGCVTTTRVGKKQALVIQNLEAAPIGLLASELKNRGYAIRTIDAEHHGGELVADESPALNGARFTIRLPIESS